MQRRKPVDHTSSSSTRIGGQFSSQNHTTNNKKYVLPTTVGSSSTNTINHKISLKTKQQKKKITTVTLLVQIIVFLMLATSFTLFYIAAKRSYASNDKKGAVEEVLAGVTNADGNAAANGDLSHHASHAPIKVEDSINNQEEVDSNEQSDKNPDEEFEEDPPKFEGASTDDIDDEQNRGNTDDGDGQQQEQRGEEESESQPEDIFLRPKKERTTAEANAYMDSQPTFSVDGEKELKKKLYPLYHLQKKGQEKLSPIITRWVGDKNENEQELKYWLPKSTTSEEVLQAWDVSVEKMKSEYREKDELLFPHLHGISDSQLVENGKEKLKNEKIHADGSSSSSSTDKPKSYPLPSPDGTHVVLKPTFGKHRENVDAVFALAEGYDLKIYLLFIESLKATGFNGDLVLSVSALGSLKPGVEEYLRANQIGDDQQGVNVVAYTVTWTCFNGEGKVMDGANEGIRKCNLVGMYGEDADEHIVADPRQPRPVATARFELYWAWSQYYNEDNWIMLIDSRDAHFQLNPFAELPRDLDGDKGLLYFFAENAEEANIGQSSFNSNWLKEAYGEENVKSFFDQPIICSGSTMGQKLAMEPYLRAMVTQYDKTNCGMKGCDQGFHNYLYYSNSLSNLSGVKDVKVFAQGTGIINNLGVLRTKPLRERGILDEKYNVLNWDKSVSSVAHQFDRDDELNKHLKEVRSEYEKQFKAGTLNESSNDSQIEVLEVDQSDPAYPAPKGAHVILEPTFGKHRPHVDAIFGLAEGYDLRIYLIFIESLKETGFKGDLVLSVSAIRSLKDGVEDYLRSFQLDEGEEGLNVVVYTVTWDCYNQDGTKAEGAKEGVRMCELVNMYGNDTDNKAVKDLREARPVATARFELYWAWSQYYDKHNWIMLIDTRDAHFQLNPFDQLDHSDNDENKDDGLLYFFAENAEVGNIGTSTFNSRWLKQAYGTENVQSFFDKPIICSGSTMGQKVAMEPYLRAMIAQFDETKCKMKGCDQGFHNYLYYTKGLTNLTGIREVVEYEQGKGIINNLGMLRTKPLREWGILNDNNQVLNWDGKVSAVAHQWDRDSELNDHLKKVRTGYAQKYWAKKKKG